MTCYVCDDDHPLGRNCPVPACPYRKSRANVCSCLHPVIKCNSSGCICQVCGCHEDVLRPTRERRQVDVPHWMSRSYPYLSIAHHFDLDYGLVLQNVGSAVQVLPEWFKRDEEYDAAMGAARRLWLFVRHVGMNHALQVLGHTNMADIGTS